MTQSQLHPIDDVKVVRFVVCSKIGEEQSPEDAEDGPPELLVSPIEARRSLAVSLFRSFTLSQHNFVSE